MSYEYICVIRDSGIVLILPIGDTIFRKHWHPIKFNAFYFNARITKIIYIGIKAVDIGFIKTIVMVPADENLKPIRQVAKPVEEIERFQLASRRCKISGMNDYVCLWKFRKTSMTSVRVGNMDYLHFV